MKIPEDSTLTAWDPYVHIYAKYEFDTATNQTSDDMVTLYKRWPKISEEATDVAAVGVPGAAAPTKNPMAAADGSVSPSSSERETLREDQSALSESAMFRGVDRLKLIYMIMSYGGEGGCGLDPTQLLKDECILACTPLHDMVELKTLETAWLVFLQWPWQQPVDQIKDYFGEKIGLYFSWLGVYTSWLIIAAVVGGFMWINVAVEGSLMFAGEIFHPDSTVLFALTDNNPDAVVIPYFAGFMGLWSAVFLENWKRVEKVTAVRWGMVGFEEEEQNRPQFSGEKILSPITGKPTLYFARSARARRAFFSQGVVVGLVLVVIATIACIFAIRIAIQSANFEIGGVPMASIIASLLIALQIQFLNGFFGEIAIKLNNQENHRTDTEYEDALIAKTFAFQFVNSFASLFYIAFVKPFIPQIDPCAGSCMLELQTTLGTIFLTRLATGNLTELGIPLLMSYLKSRERDSAALAMKRAKDNSANPAFPHFVESSDGVEMQSRVSGALSDEGKHEISEVERTFLMPAYDVMLGTFDDYAEMVIQFGYTTMFVAAFPLATVMSFVNNYVEIRVDGWKLCQLCRRAEPRSCEDIGTWYVILELTSMASIFINSGLVAFTGTNTLNYTWALRVWIFILMSTGLFCIRMMVAWLIPDVPAEVEIQLARQEYIVGKVMDNVVDEDDSDLTKNLFIVPVYLVNTTDDDPL